MLSPTELFAYLGAPLINQRWSWGAERTKDGAVFLRVWQDECQKMESCRAAQVTFNAYFKNRPTNAGNVERLRHVQLIQSGRPSYMIMCVAVDPSAEPRVISKVNDREVFVGGRLLEHDGNIWLEMASRIPIARARA